MESIKNYIIGEKVISGKSASFSIFPERMLPEIKAYLVKHKSLFNAAWFSRRIVSVVEISLQL